MLDLSVSHVDGCVRGRTWLVKMGKVRNCSKYIWINPESRLFRVEASRLRLKIKQTKRIIFYKILRLYLSTIFRLFLPQEPRPVS